MGGSIIGSGIVLAGLKKFRKRKAKLVGKQKRSAGDAHQAQTAVVPSQALVEKSDEKQEVNHYLKTSSASLGFALFGHFLYAPLIVPAVLLVVYSSRPIFKSAWRNLLRGQIKASLIDSIAITGGLATRYYLASSLVTLVYFSAVKLLMETEDKSKRQLGNIFGEQPRSVWLIKDGTEIELPFEALDVGDIIVIHAGELIPIDGVISDGYATIDQHALTGESQPAEKNINDPVLAGTVVIEGRIHVRVEKCGKETVAAQIGEILQNTADFRSSVEAKSIKLSDRLAPPTLMAGGVALATLGPVSGVAVVSCNFSEIIRVVAPLGVLNFLKLATDQGILIKDGRSLELLSGVDTVVFDKTGTLTIEQPHVGCIHVWGDVDQDELLRLAAAAEYKQAHPIAKAVLQAANERKLTLPSIDNARYDIGFGIKVELDQQTVHVGSLRFMQMEDIQLSPDIGELQRRCNSNGYSLVYVAVDRILAGAVELHSTIRPEAKAVIKKLRHRNLKLCIISGDHEKPTGHLARSLGIDEYFAETLPENKAKLVEQLKAQGRSVCFIGDGINDAIALKTANVSISLQGASTAATDTAGIILMDKNLSQLPQLFELAEGLDKNMRKSFASALIPGVLGVTGVFLFHFGIYSSLVLYVVSLATGTINSMTPLLTYRKKKSNKQLEKIE